MFNFCVHFYVSDNWKKYDLNSYHCAFDNWTTSSMYRLQLKSLKGKKLLWLFFHYFPKQLGKSWKGFFSADQTGEDVLSWEEGVTVQLTRWIQWAEIFSARSVELAGQKSQLSSLKSVQGYWALQQEVLSSMLKPPELWCVWSTITSHTVWKLCFQESQWN